MAKSRNDPELDNRTDLQKEIDRQQMLDDATKAWDAQQKAMKEFENNLLFGLCISGQWREIPYISDAQRASESMQQLFKMRPRQQQGRQGSPPRAPMLERSPRYGNKAPLPGSSAGGWLGLQQTDFDGRLPQGIMGRRSDLTPSTPGFATNSAMPDDPNAETPLARLLQEAANQSGGDADRVAASSPGLTSDRVAAPSANRSSVRFEGSLGDTQSTGPLERDARRARLIGSHPKSSVDGFANQI